MDYLVDLEIAIDTIRDYHEKITRNRRANAGMAILAGQVLCKVRNQLQHGDWLPWLEKTGVAGRTARLWMSLARAGFTADDVMAHGGIRRAAESLKNPQNGNVANLPNGTLNTVTVSLAEFIDMHRELGALEERKRALLAENTELWATNPPNPETWQVFQENRAQIRELEASNRSLQASNSALQDEVEAYTARLKAQDRELEDLNAKAFPLGVG